MTTIRFSCRGLRKRWQKAGMTKIERTSEANRAMTRVKASGQEHLALDPLEGDDRDEGQGDDELAEDARLADLEHGLEDDRGELRPPAPASLRWRWTFSTWMMVASMIMPMEMASPPSDMRLADSPASRIMMKVNRADSGRARMTMKAPRKLRRKR